MDPVERLTSSAVMLEGVLFLLNAAAHPCGRTWVEESRRGEFAGVLRALSRSTPSRLSPVYCSPHLKFAESLGSAAWIADSG